MSTSTSHRRQRAATVSVLAATATIASLTGCGSSGGAASASGPLSVYSDNPSWEPGFIKSGEALKELTGHGLKPVTLPSTSNYEQVVQTSIGTKKTNDLVKWWSGYKLQDLASSGNLTDLTAVWEANVAKGWLNDDLRSSYSYQGKVYGLPVYQSYWVVFYDKSIFADNNLTPPTTYVDFEAAAAKIKSSGVTPIWTGQADGWPSFITYQSLVAGLSPSFYQDLTENKSSFTDSVSADAMDIWKGWIDKGWTTPADSKLADAPALMKADKVAMFPIGTWENANMKISGMVPGTDYGAFLMPTVAPDAQKSTFVEGGAWTVPTNAPNHAAAIKTMENWLDPSVQTVWSEFLGDSSANPTVPATDPVIKEVQAAISAEQPLLLNRFYEAFPSKLVITAVSQLDGFMVHPDQGASIRTAIQASADAEWANLDKQNGK